MLFIDLKSSNTPFCRAFTQLIHSLLVLFGSSWARDLDKVVEDYPTTENGGYPTDFTRDIIPVCGTSFTCLAEQS